MKYRVRMTDKAEADVANVLQWFRSQSAIAAGSKWLAELTAKIDTLETMPQRCGKAAEAEEVGIEIRELLFGKKRGTYRIVFQIRGRTVYILRIWHSARDALKSEDL